MSEDERLILLSVDCLFLGALVSSHLNALPPPLPAPSAAMGIVWLGLTFLLFLGHALDGASLRPFLPQPRSGSSEAPPVTS